jgi:hypothetical protein
MGSARESSKVQSRHAVLYLCYVGVVDYCVFKFGHFELVWHVFRPATVKNLHPF